MKYRIEYVPNSDVIGLKTTRLLFRGIDSFHRGSTKRMGRYEEFLKAVLRIQGVTELTAHDYELSVHKGSLFTWETIIPRIHAALQEHVAKKRPVVSLRPTRMHIDASGRAHYAPAV